MLSKQLLNSVSITGVKMVPDGILQRCAIEAVAAHDVGLYANEIFENIHLALRCSQVHCSAA